MVKVCIELNDQEFEDISKKINLINHKNEIMNQHQNYTVEDFVIGAIVDKLSFLNNIVSNQQSIIQDKLQINNQFKEVAKERNIKQVDICKKTGISKAMLSQVFNNKVNITMDTFFKVWIALECPPIQNCFKTGEK